MLMEITQTFTPYSRGAWRRWLENHHNKATEIWLVHYKSHTGRRTIRYEEAVEEALCFGWIDGLVKRIDDARYAQRYTPMRNTSKWSALNLQRVTELMREGKMMKAGLSRLPPSAADPSYDIRPVIGKRQPLKVPVYFQKELALHPVTLRNFESLAPSYKRNYILWISAAKTEKTRRKRMDESIALLQNGEKLGLK